jgi:hypothetical protein
MKNCNQDGQKLPQELIMAAARHYKADHTSCHITSRGRSDPEYEPSKRLITDPVAEKLLVEALQTTSVFKNPEDYKYFMTTCAVHALTMHF